MAAQLPHSGSEAYRPDIDGLRAIAVTSVLLFHAFPEQVSGGFVGVDIFFVISGFLITRILFSQAQAGRFSLFDFYRARARRIFPALALVIFSCLAFGWFALFPTEFAQLGKHAMGGVLFAANLVNWSESGYFDNLAETKPLLHLWSLGIEEQFYIAWPLLLAMLAQKRRRLYLVLGGLIALSLLAGIVLTGRHPVAAFFSPVARSWELLAGALLGIRAAAGKAASASVSPAPAGCVIFDKHLELQSLVGLVAIVASIALLSPATKFPGAWAILPVLGSMLIINAGPRAWGNRVLLSAAPMVAIGLISYPLYLWHWPLLSFPRVIQGEQPGLVVRLLALAAAFVLAILTYQLIEKPFRFGKLSTRAVPLLASTMLFAGLAGAAIFAASGLPSRSSIVAYAANHEQLTRGPQKNQACKDKFAQSVAHIDFCLLEDNGAQATVAIVGDSHAHAAFPGIAEELRRRGFGALLLGTSGCPSLLDTAVGARADSKKECRSKTESVMQALQSVPALTHVLLISRGPVYLSGRGVGVAGSDINGEPWISTADFLAGMQRTVDMLDKRGVTAAIVTENPEMPFFPDACIRRPFWTGKKDCAIQRAAADYRQREYLALLAQVRKATVLPVIPTFCPDGKCGVFGPDGALLYADDDHLSIAGSRFQATRIIAPYLDRLPVYPYSGNPSPQRVPAHLPEAGLY